MDVDNNKFKINPHLRVINITDNEILAKHGARSFFSRSWTDKGRTGLLGRVVSSMRQLVSLEELLDGGVIKSNEQQDAKQLIDQLIEEKILVNADQDLVDVYYRVIQDADQPLADTRIGIIGCGQSGSRIARQFAQSGIKHLLISDDAKINNTSTVHRFLGIESRYLQEGAPLADSVAESLQQFELNRVSTITEDSFSKENINRVFEECDFVVEALDEYMQTILHRINEVALEADKPWAMSVFDGSEGIAGPIFIPGETCCYNEYNVQTIAATGTLKRDVITYLDAVDAMGQPDLGIAPPPYIDVVSGQFTAGVLTYLTTGRSYLVSRAIRTDFERMSVDYEDIKTIPRCPACAPFRPFRNVFL